MATTQKCFLWLLIASSFCIFWSEVLASETPTAYEMLQRFDFPKGILPIGVQSYKLSQDGSFAVIFKTDCEFKLIGGYQLRYQNKISGKVQAGSLSDLRGVSVKILFAWLNINGVVRKGADLSFYVGPLSASFPLCNFDDSPQCGCGFDCGGAAVTLSAAAAADS